MISSGRISNVRDKRYSVRMEWCGAPKRMSVVRFCGRWIGSRETRAEGLRLARLYRKWRVAYETARILSDPKLGFTV
jgi:hypothetical protein